MTWLRALLAAGLSVIMPGAGHALIRDWFRAALFAGLFLSAMIFFVPIDQIAAAGPMTSYGDVIEQANALTAETSPMAQFFLSFIALFAAIDATFRALGFPPGSGDADGPTCPECGEEIDTDLEFCHWCTARLETEPSGDEPTHS